MEVPIMNPNYLAQYPLQSPLNENQNLNPNLNPNAPNIHFAPVIKIVNDGNDMSQQIVDPLQPQPPISFVGVEGRENIKNEVSSKIDNNTEIDFSIPIIKK